MPYYGQFDLNKDGINEVSNGWSINIFPIPPDVRKGVNVALDNDDFSHDIQGVLKVREDFCDGMVTYYISHPL